MEGIIINNYSNIKPKEVFKWFNEISMIPRCSGNEKALSDFLVVFAKSRDLKYYQDEELNVIIQKKASVGYESAPTVIVQGHMDMVCQKGPNIKHDFTSDPIIWDIKGDYLYAKGTTLGSDNGIAVAYCLALLSDDTLRHPNLEVLITTNEETGMDGANAINGDLLKGEILLNLDAEEEGVFLSSCSGGANSFVKFEKKFEDYKSSAIKISIKNLLGGHSGMEIHKQRANAIKLMGRLLDEIGLYIDYRIINLEGGSNHNAIPNDSVCEIAISEKDKEQVLKKIADFEYKIKKEYKKSDPDIAIETEFIVNNNKALTEDLSERLTKFMLLVPYGVKDMSLEINDLVQSSSNIGLIINEDNHLIFMSCVRSSVDSLLKEQIRYIKVIADILNAQSWIEKEYPAWQFKENSYIRDLSISAYKELYEKTPEISAAHCGLETGIINSKKPSLDIISFGPNLLDVHTYNEHLSISSVERVWDFIKLLLEKIK